MRNLIELFRHLPPLPLRRQDVLLRVPAGFIAAHALTAPGEGATFGDLLLTEFYFVALAFSLSIAPLLLFTACSLPGIRDRQLPATGLKALLSLLQPSLKQARAASPAPLPPAPACRNVWIVNTGTTSIPIPVEHICYIFREGKHNFLRTYERVDYLVPQPLDKIQQLLDNKQFFRVNRRMIIHCQACQAYKPAGYGKLALTLCIPFHAVVVVSQLKASAFRKWMQR